MCGIAGHAVASADAVPDLAVVRRMTRRLRHRGPDDEGVVAAGSGALGARRLQVIDLVTGHQPMTGEDERVWVVFNGEIYNYRELGARLAALGHVFHTKSDTEVLVHGFEAWGADVLQHLEGMFAIAWWDRSTRTLLLARDRLGIKPLYYALLPGGIAFASEVRALLEHPRIGRDIDLVSLSRYLSHDWLPAPHAMLRSIRKLAPGHWLMWTDGRVKTEPYWDVPIGGRRLVERDAVDLLRSTLDAVVRDHMVSDVPLGVFLSGGIDSATVAAMAAPHAKGPLRTFSIGFDDASFDESTYARRVAESIGADHHEERLDARAGLELVAELPELLDEPLGDASFLPTYLLSRFARRQVTVALSGDGGDELFAGYPTYQAHRLAELWARLPRPLRDRVLRPAIEHLPVSHADLSLDFRLKRFVAGADAPPVERHAIWMGTFTPAEQRELFTPDALVRMGEAPSWNGLESLASRVPMLTGLARTLYLDLRGYLGEGVLTKVDRASMACSLEVRVPLLDRRLVELAWSLPDDLKLRGFTTKYVLKRAMAERLPAEVIRRRKKGFGVPMARWLRGPLRQLLREALAPAALEKQGLFRADVTDRLLHEHDEGRQDHRKKLYTLLVFQLWAARWRVT